MSRRLYWTLFGAGRQEASCGKHQPRRIFKTQGLVALLLITSEAMYTVHQERHWCLCFLCNPPPPQEHAHFPCGNLPELPHMTLTVPFPALKSSLARCPVVLARLMSSPAGQEQPPGKPGGCPAEAGAEGAGQWRSCTNTS